MKLRTHLTILAAVIAATWILNGCGDDSGLPTSPSVSIEPTQSVLPPSVTTTSEAQDRCGPGGPMPVVKPAQSTMMMDASGKITATIKATFDGPGDLIIYLWDSEVNDGDQYGSFPPNEQFTFTPGEVRRYDFRIAAEIDRDGDGKADDYCQNDKHRIQVSPPPVTSCDLSCVEQRSEVATNGQGFVRWLSCNRSVTWDSNADETEAGDQSFHGYWSGQREDRTATVTAALKGDRSCRTNFKWTVPGDPCLNADVRFKLEELQDENPLFASYRVTILNVDPGDRVNVSWGDGANTSLSEGESEVHRYQRTDPAQKFRIRVSTDCVNRDTVVEVDPASCDALNPPFYEITDVSLQTQMNHVNVTACFEVGNLEAIGDIFWRRGNSSTVKKTKRVKVACGETETFCLNFQSSGKVHQCRNGALYSARLNPVDGGVLETKIHDIACPK